MQVSLLCITGTRTQSEWVISAGALNRVREEGCINVSMIGRCMGNWPYYKARLNNQLPVRDLLMHIYVLVPVLDAEKHY